MLNLSMPPLRLRRLAASASVLMGMALAASLPATAQTFTATFATPIAGDVVPVTVVLTDVPAGDAVDVTASIPAGAGDLLGLFGVLATEGLAAGMAVDDPSGVVTQYQFQPNEVWKVGGGNTMSPIRQWDWGLRFGGAGSAGGPLESVELRLTGPGLSTEELLLASNQGWILGVRIQSTTGTEGSAKIGLGVAEPPTIAIEAPEEGALVTTPDVEVSGSFTGDVVLVDVDGIPAATSGSSFTAIRTLTDGPHTLTATARSALGSASDAVAIFVDTEPPVVTITAPADGTLTADAMITVTGTVSDVSPIAAVLVEGVPAILEGDQFHATVPLALGSQSLQAVATDAAGHVGTATVLVTRGEAPTIAIQSPVDGLLTNQSPVQVTGTVTGTGPVTVAVAGVPATVTAGSFAASVSLAEGGQTLTATATNPFGGAQDTVTVTLDTTPPLVTISAPADGAEVEEESISVTGAVVDASPIAALQLNGAALPPGNSFAGSVTLEEGPNSILVEATDAAGNIGTGQVTVTRTAASTLGVTLDTPTDGALLSRERITVAGTVTEPSAAVSVNGVAATVTGQQYLAAGVRLAEGPNTLTATATIPGASATASSTVIYNAPPVVVITSPPDGAVVSEATVDVEGQVDDASSFVDVNGVVATVGSAGRFFAQAVPLDPGANVLTARAIDAFGAQGQDATKVTRDAASGPAIRVGLAAQYSLSARTDAEADSTSLIAFGDNEEFLEGLMQAGLSPAFFDPPIHGGQVGINFWMYVLSETADPVSLELQFADDGSPVEFQTVWDQGVVPIEALDDSILFQQPGDVLNPQVFRRQDLEVRYVHAFISVMMISGEQSPPRVPRPIRVVATQGAVTDTIEALYDPEKPRLFLESPIWGSVIGGNSVHVTGSVDEDVTIESIRYTVDHDNLIVAEGSVKTVDGRFTIPDLFLPDGSSFVQIEARDLVGNFDREGIFLTADPSAPAVKVFPADGVAFLVDSTPVSLNFSVPTTIVSVNGVADGRSFPAGLAEDVLTVPLGLGANPVELELDAGNGVFDFSFTYFRVDALSEVQITQPADGSYVNTETLEVTGRVPRGTPFVEVNGVAGIIESDGVSFHATIPVPTSTGIELVDGDAVPKPFGISAVALPTNAADSIQVRPDFAPPEFRIVLPEDGAATLDPEVAYGGWVSEPALVTVELGGASSSVRTIRDRDREQEVFFNLFNVQQFHRFDAGALPLALGGNPVLLRASDRAGNVTELDLSLLHSEAALQLVSPTGPVPALITDLELEALQDVVVDAVFAAGRLLPGFTGLSMPSGAFTLGGVPLVPGTNTLRIVHHAPGGPQQVVNFIVESSSTAATIATGTVTDAATGAPIGGALVRLTVGGSTLVTVTDADGLYHAVVEPGLLEGEVQAEGFADASFEVTVLAGATADVDLGLNPDGLEPLPPPAGAYALRGTIIDAATSQLLGDVTVDVVGESLVDTSDASGEFLLDGVPLGTQTLRFRRPGFLDEFQSLDVPSIPAGTELPVTFTLSFDAGLAGTLAVDPAAPGRVLDRLTSQPVAGATIEARRLPTGELLGTTVADTEGVFALSGLPPFATVEFVASSPDHLEDSVTALVVPKGEEILDLRLRSATEGSLAGTVSDSSTGEPLAYAEIRLGGGAVLATLSDRDGTFELVGVTPGTHDVLVKHPAYFGATLSNVTVMADAATPLDVALVARPTTGGLQGIVRDAGTGAPIAGATVAGPGGVSSTTAADGAYSLGALPSGLVSLAITAAGYPVANRTAVVDADLDPSTPTVRRADLDLTQDGSFTLEATASIPMTGGFVALPDGSVRIDFPPLALSKDAIVTLRRPASVALAPGDPVTLDPKLGESGLLGASEAVQISLEAAVPGDPAPVFVGPVVLSMRYSASEAAAFDLFEDGITPMYFDADQGHWTLPRTVPYLHGVDRVNRRVSTGLSLILTEAGDPITAQLHTREPVRLAGFPGLPVLRPIRDFVLGLVAKAKSIVTVQPAFAMHFMAPGDFDLDAPQEEKQWTQNARPLFFFHGWDPKATLFNVGAMSLDEVKSGRYHQIMEDVVNATDGVYRPIFPSYNTRQGLEGLAGLVAGGMRTWDDRLRGEPIDDSEPASGGAFSHFDSYGFSMGGLIERSYQRVAKGTRRSINSMITMGTPHHGGLQQVRLAVDGVFGLTVGLAAIPGLEGLLAAWSPGTNDLLDYSDRVCAILPELSGNASLCRLNRDTGSAPNQRLTLIAGTNPNSLFDLYDGFLGIFDDGAFKSALEKIGDFIRDPEFFGVDLNLLNGLASEGFLATGCLRSDGVVCVWSAHALEGPTAPRVGALADVVEKTSERNFDHHSAGTGTQRILPYVEEDVIQSLSDWFVGRLLQPTDFVPPTASQEGQVISRMTVEWNVPHASFDRLALVVYGGYIDDDGQLRFKLIAGADETGMADPATSISVSGNSVATDDNPLGVEVILPVVDPADPSTAIVEVRPTVLTLGASRPTVPLTPDDDVFYLPPFSP